MGKAVFEWFHKRCVVVFCFRLFNVLIRFFVIEWAAMSMYVILGGVEDRAAWV